MKVGLSFSLRQGGWLFLRGFFAMDDGCRVVAILLLLSKVSTAAQLLRFLRVPRHIFKDC